MLKTHAGKELVSNGLHGLDDLQVVVESYLSLKLLLYATVKELCIRLSQIA